MNGIWNRESTRRDRDDESFEVCRDSLANIVTRTFSNELDESRVFIKFWLIYQYVELARMERRSEIKNVFNFFVNRFNERLAVYWRV